MVSLPCAQLAAPVIVRKVYPDQLGHVPGSTPDVRTWNVRPAGSGESRLGCEHHDQLPSAPAASAAREKRPAASPRVLASGCNRASSGLVREGAPYYAGLLRRVVDSFGTAEAAR